MVEIVYLGCGITSNVDKIMRLIKENPNELIGVGRVHDREGWGDRKKIWAKYISELNYNIGD